MGCYDTVLVPCPKCGERNPFQSKGGACSFTDYDLEECPPDVLSDVNRHSPIECEGCGTLYRVEVQSVGVPISDDSPG